MLALCAPAWAQAAEEVKITANEFSFKPARVTVPGGEVRLVVTNRGKFPHSLAIVGRVEKIGFIDSGETKTLTLRFDKAQEVVFYCAQPGHRNKGMEGKLIVQE